MSHMPSLIPRSLLELLTTLTTKVVTNQCHILKNYVNCLSSEENRPNMGTGVNCLQSKITRGTKTNLEQDTGLTDPKDFRSTEGISLTGSIIFRKQFNQEFLKYLGGENTGEIF